jgi:serine/threonine protein kinase
MPEGPNPELWKRVDEVLDGALELPSAERAAFVATACAGDQKLRDEVMSLLLAEQQAGSFMTGSAMGVAARALAEENHRSDNPLTIGDEIGKYRIERLLGAGGMGEVYLAHEANLNRKVALKILPAKFVVDPERVARFEREARVISALNHPNLITIYEIGSTADLHFIAMEFVEGKTLSELSHEKLKLRDLLLIIAQAAEALIAAHQAGIVHRDIKPDNIMVRADGYVKVLDFGLAKLTEFEQEGSGQDQAQTQAGAVLGTLVYMSPEQATGETLDHRTDIWSLGVVLYELVTGAAPFKQEMRVETVKAILQSDPDSVRDSNPSLPAELDHIIEKALEKNRELRYQTASDFRADLRRLLRSMDSSPSWQSESIVLPRRRPARRWLWPVAACAVVKAESCYWLAI